jgi:hypothetical protein
MPFVFDSPALNGLSPNGDYASITTHDLDLEHVSYSLRDLGFLIVNASICLRTVLYTQRLTAEFCAKYLCDDYARGDGDSDISVAEILAHQPHIDPRDLEN